MKRRTLLQLIGITFLPIPDLVMGAEAQGAHIQLYNEDEPVSEQLPVEFRFNSHMKVELQPSAPITVNRAVLRAPEIGERVQSFEPIEPGPEHVLEVQWACVLP